MIDRRVEELMRQANGAPLSDNELAIDWQRLMEENYALRIALDQTRLWHGISTYCLIVMTIAFVWSVLR